VLHSPSHPEAKGTPIIRAAVDELRREGVDLDYVELVNVTHDRVLDEIARSDFVVDQLYSDTPMAGFAAEAASLGRAAVVGCEDWRTALDGLDPESIPPSVRCAPSEANAAIRALATDPDLRARAGREAQGFVRARWSPKLVAQNLLLALDGPPPAWVCDPARVDYPFGCGLSHARAAENVRGVVDAGGESALALDDKPKLKARIVALATGGGE
jgi:hypothetical protein